MRPGSGSQHGGRRPHIAGIARGEMDDGGAPEDVGQDMDLGGRPAAQGIDNLIFRPPLLPWAQRCALV